VARLYSKSGLIPSPTLLLSRCGVKRSLETSTMSRLFLF
jgi:hypothetical protein